MNGNPQILPSTPEKVFPNADEDWIAIGAGILEIYDTAGTLERFVEIARAMGLNIVVGPK